MQTKKSQTLPYCFTLQNYQGTTVLASSLSLRLAFLWANIILFLESNPVFISVRDWFHQLFLSSSAVRSSSIFWLRFCPWFESQISGYRHFFLFSKCPLMSPILKVGSFQKLFLPETAGILPLILMGLELVSVALSSLSTNYSIEAKSSVLLSIAQFPDTFFCQTGFFNILNLHLGVFSCTFYTDSVSPLKKCIQLWVYVFPLSHNSWPQREQAFITNCRKECTTLSSTWHSCSSSTSALQPLIQHPDSSLHSLIVED